jgi:Flp pilus assembly protein CpaB
VSRSPQRRPGGPSTFTGPVIALAVAASVVVIFGMLLAFGLLDLSKFRSNERSTAGLVAVPTPARTIPAYTRVRRDHLWDPGNGRFAVIYLPPRAVTREMLVNISDVIGRVLEAEKAAGYVFTESDFLPKGTREGIVAGIPAGKRAVRISADKVDGLYGLHSGDRFDLLATMPIDASQSGGGQTFNFAGVYGQQLALQARLSNWDKQATVRVIVQSAVIVEPMTTRGIPIYQTSLTEGSATRVRPVQEAVIAIAPDEVALLTEAMAVGAKLTTIPRSGRPDDPVNSRTPDLRPVSPFTPPGAGGVRAAESGVATDPNAKDFSVVETIMGQKRALTAVPRR